MLVDLSLHSKGCLLTGTLLQFFAGLEEIGYLSGTHPKLLGDLIITPAPSLKLLSFGTIIVALLASRNGCVLTVLTNGSETHSFSPVLLDRNLFSELTVEGYVVSDMLVGIFAGTPNVSSGLIHGTNMHKLTVVTGV